MQSSLLELTAVLSASRTDRVLMVLFFQAASHMHSKISADWLSGTAELVCSKRSCSLSASGPEQISSGYRGDLTIHLLCCSLSPTTLCYLKSLLHAIHQSSNFSYSDRLLSKGCQLHSLFSFGSEGRQYFMFLGKVLFKQWSPKTAGANLGQAQ